MIFFFQFLKKLFLKHFLMVIIFICDLFYSREMLLFYLFIFIQFYVNCFQNISFAFESLLKFNFIYYFSNKKYL